MKLTNEQIINGCKKGDHRSQMQLYDNYCDAMFNIAFRYLNNADDAKDAMQEGFIKAFVNIDGYESIFSIGAWLKRIVINQCLDVLKKRKLQFEAINDDTYFIENDADWLFDVQITKKEIIKSIQELPEKYKVVVQLYLIDGYNHEEISEIINIPIETSRTHLHRGRLKLQKKLKTKLV